MMMLLFYFNFFKHLKLVLGAIDFRESFLPGKAFENSLNKFYKRKAT